MADDDDWVGTPPEGRISRDRADAEHWQRSTWRFTAVAGGILLVLVVLGVVLVLVAG